jgi:hypothetical protein
LELVVYLANLGWQLFFDAERRRDELAGSPCLPGTR